MRKVPAAKLVRPYRNFKFRISFDPGKVVALVSKVSALKRTTEVVEWRDGNHPMGNTVFKLPGKTKYEPINVEQGLSLDEEFYKWANLVNDFKDNKAKKDNDFRKDLSLEFMDLDGEVVIKYKLINCWVSEFTTEPDLDANGNTVGIKSLKIEHEGWDVDK